LILLLDGLVAELHCKRLFFLSFLQTAPQLWPMWLLRGNAHNIAESPNFNREGLLDPTVRSLEGLCLAESFYEVPP
jgi:hypothetical protein